MDGAADAERTVRRSRRAQSTESPADGGGEDERPAPAAAEAATVGPEVLAAIEAATRTQLETALASAEGAFDARVSALESRLRASAAEAADKDARIAALERELADAKAAAEQPEPEEESVFCPHDAGENPHVPRPRHAPLRPHLYDIRGDRTADALVYNSKDGEEKKGAHYWEYFSLVAICSWLFDIVHHAELHFPRLQSRILSTGSITSDDGVVHTSEADALILDEVYWSVNGVYESLANPRLTFMQLRAMLAPGGHVPAEKRSLLAMLEDRLYGPMRSPLPSNISDIYTKVLKQWEKEMARQAVKQSAASEARARANTTTAAPKRPGSLGKKKKKKPWSAPVTRKQE